MFGSNDDKKTPAAAGEKKSLFGWLRKKPQEPVVEQPPVTPEPAPAPAPVIEEEPPKPIVQQEPPTLAKRIRDRLKKIAKDLDIIMEDE